jgi:hypothetical protein
VARPRESVKKRVVAVLSGLKKKKLPATVTSLVVAGKHYPLLPLEKKLEIFLGYWKSVDDFTEALRGAVRLRNAKARDARDFLDDLELAIVYALGRKNPKLRDFGIKPQKQRRRLTAKEKVRANAKRKATRARNRG